MEIIDVAVYVYNVHLYNRFHKRKQESLTIYTDPNSNNKLATQPLKKKTQIQSLFEPTV